MNNKNRDINLSGFGNLPRNDGVENNSVYVSTEQVRLAGNVGRANVFRDILNGLFSDILRPSLQNTAMDFITNFASSLIFGATQRMNQPPNMMQRQNYNQPYRVRQNQIHNYHNEPTRVTSGPRNILEDFIFDNRQIAVSILSELQGTVNEYGKVSVAALYSMVGRTPNLVQHNVGWGEELFNTRIIPTGGGGWMIDFPAYRNI